jgi:hypothetical protein
MEDLSCNADLTQGPEALLLTFSTPLGAAKALLTPQLVRAALLNSKCREVLAVPAQKHLAGSSSSSSKGLQQQGSSAAGFSWTVSGKVSAGLSPDGSGTNLAAGGGGGGLGSSAAGTAYAAHDVAGVAGAGFFASHKTEVYAAVTLEVVQTAHTVGRRGAGRVFDPDCSSSSSSPPGAAAAELPAATEAIGRQASEAGTAAAAAELIPGSSSRSSSKSVRLQQLQLAAYVLLAAMAASQLSSRPAWALLQLLLLAAVAALQLRSSSSSSSVLHPASSSRAAAAANGSRTPKSVFSDAGTPTAAANSTLAAAKQTAFGDSSSAAVAAAAAAGEDVTCCGWSLRLVSGDIVSVPGRHLQLQIALARADKGLTALRQRMASMNLSMGKSRFLCALRIGQQSISGYYNVL